MTVTDVLLNFRQALLAIVPAVERVGIPWQRPDAYDEWDVVASALFDALVVEIFRWSIPIRSPELFQMPRYDLLLNSYAGLSVVEVKHPALPSGRYVFHAFGTSESSFDVVELRKVSENGDPYEQKLTTCAVQGVDFRLRLDPSLNGGDLLEEITIELRR